MARHAVARLCHEHLAHDPLRPRLDRAGPRLPRCDGCRLLTTHCLCALRPVQPSRVGFCLLMAGFEALKPSNTGWLIADVVPDTFAFAWQRTAVDPALLALLADPRWQPVVVFPGEYAEPARVITALPSEPVATPANLRAADAPGAANPARRPLFILIDGTWSEARKVFRKSPWLDRLPVLSLQPEALSRYRLRRSIHAHHFCTAEVAALCLALADDEAAAQTLGAWLDVFTSRYLAARHSVPVDDQDAAHQQLRELRSGLRSEPTASLKSAGPEPAVAAHRAQVTATADPPAAGPPPG